MQKTMSERPRWGVLHHIFGREVRHTIKKINPIGSKTNEKGGQLDRKLRR